MKFTMISLRLPNALLKRCDAKAKKLERGAAKGKRGFRSQVIINAIEKGVR